MTRDRRLPPPADTEAERIRRKIAEGAAYDDIFPAQGLWTPPPPEPFADGFAEFVACERPSAHEGTPLRYFRLECQHLTSELTLPDMTADDDGAVLAHMLPAAKARAADGGKLCLCWPKGWRRE